jgi:hypothetical protein
MESNLMLSWRPIAGVAVAVPGTDLKDLRILHLPGDSRIAGGVLPEATLGKESGQIAERREIDARRAEPFHAGAGGRIEHPVRQHNDYARSCFKVNDAAIGALLAVLQVHPSPTQRMPRIVDFHFCPTMGRMNARLQSGAGIGASPAPTRVGAARRRSIR